ncbi:MAG: oligosaccharide repeat unit polymerase [Solirubrobacterales bacterium]|nr:oligosaccharide repeat unit polymerase [Solirubrobacterales bacterium]
MLRTAALALAAVAAGVGCAALAMLCLDHPRTGLLVAMCVIVPLPWAMRMVQRRWDVFEPIHLMAFAIGILFIWRPFWELHTNIQPYPGFDTRDGFNGAMMIGLVGTVFLYLGYFSKAGAAIVHRFPPLADHWDAERSVRFVRRMLVLAAFLTAMYAAQAGIHYVISTYTGRSGQATLSSQSSGYFYQGPYLTIPAAFILLIAYTRRKTTATLVLLIAVVVVAVGITVPAGDRTFMLELAMPIAAMWYLRRNRRPRVISLAVLFIVFLIFINVSLVFRSTANRAGNSLPAAVAHAFTHPQDELAKFISGADPSEFSALEVEYVGYKNHQLGFKPGGTVSSLITGWIPHEFFAGGKKPLTPLQYVTWTLFPTTQGGGSYGPSMFGSMYIDYGWFTLALFAALVGIALRSLWEYFLMAPRTSGMQLAFAASMPLAIIMLRNDVDDIVYRSVFFVVPIILCIVSCSRPSRKDRKLMARQARAAAQRGPAVSVAGPTQTGQPAGGWAPADRAPGPAHR